ncbi:MAG: hypothetical protein WC959_02415 [Kiritimatiellales bacterium]
MEWFQHENPIICNVNYPYSEKSKIYLNIVKDIRNSKVLRFSDDFHSKHLNTILTYCFLSYKCSRPVAIYLNGTKSLKSVLKALEDLKYIKFKSGYKIRNFYQLSKFRPTERLNSQFKNINIIPLKDILNVRIITKKRKSASGNNQTKEITILSSSTSDGKFISSYNTFIKNQNITCKFKEGDFKNNDHLYGFSGVFNLNSQIARIYSEQEKVGGRLYNQDFFCVQHLSKKLRKRIKINGEKTVELDFEGLHPSMLYHLASREVSGDPYNIFPQATDKNLRKCVKFSFNILINCSSDKEAIRALNKALFKEHPELGEVLKNHYKGVATVYKRCNTLLNDVKKYHSSIKSSFCSSAWKTLQFEDSELMLEILETLMEKEIVALPIHDSIIVQERHEQIAKNVMKSTYFSKFKKNINVKVS